MRNYFYGIILIISGCNCINTSATEPGVKNVILLIGDGMGTSQVFAAMMESTSELELERAQYIGFSKTSSANNNTTDSGAGGTAISTGMKTNNFNIGIDKDKQELPTILELAEKKGLSTGLVVTSSITHATPASFIAHHNNRYDELIIASQFPGSGIDIFIGGGKKYFDTIPSISEQLRSEGYSIVYNVNEIDDTSAQQTGCLAAYDALPRVLDGRGSYLQDATQIALKKLSFNKKGFFLMIEGSQIDWAGHDNDYNYLVTEMLDLDKTIGMAFNFADDNPGTLVIVTADHETGALAFIGDYHTNVPVKPHFASGSHSPLMVPVFAYGTGASKMAGIYENTKIFYLITEALGMSPY